MSLCFYCLILFIAQSPFVGDSVGTEAVLNAPINIIVNEMKQSQIVVNRHPKHQQASGSEELVLRFCYYSGLLLADFFMLFGLTDQAAGIYSIPSLVSVCN
jgi:hypothetical protein